MRGRVPAKGSNEIRVSPCMTFKCPEGNGNGPKIPLAMCSTLKVECHARLEAEAVVEATATDKVCWHQCPVQGGGS